MGESASSDGSPAVLSGWETASNSRLKKLAAVLVLTLVCSLTSRGQNQSPQGNQAPGNQPQAKAHGRSPGGDVGSGAGDVGKGTGKGAGKAAEGVGKGAGDLATLHPLNAAGAVGKGAGVGAKDVGVGAAKGTCKIVKGTGRGIKKIF